eukprot:SAG11_NODE_4764_length_1776_cov_1.983900_2_plen_58_part_00
MFPHKFTLSAQCGTDTRVPGYLGTGYPSTVWYVPLGLVCPSTGTKFSANLLVLNLAS